jgi:hypothetical protein
VHHHRGLVLLHRYHVVAPLLDHLLAEVALAEHRVPRDHLPPQRQDAQELQGRLVLVGLAVDPDLGHHGRDPRGVGAQEVDAGHLVGGAAAQRLAVQGEGVAQVGAAPFQPGGQGALVGADVEAAEEVGEGGLAGGGPAGEAQGLGQLGAVVAGELGDGLQAPHAGQQGDGGEAEDGPQGVAQAPGLPDLRQQVEDFLKGDGGGGRRVHASSGFRAQATPPKLTQQVNASLPEN